METSAGMLDRAAGAMVGTACGDALGAPYEFGGPYPQDMPVGMIGGGAFDWAPGEWTDDTSMGVPLLEFANEHVRLRDRNLGEVVRAWFEWARDAADVGNQTSVVLETVRAAHERRMREPGPRDDWDLEDHYNTYVFDARMAADTVHRRWARSAGNGSLMRTAPIGLRAVEDRSAASEYARQQSALTHAGPEAQDACALWTCAIGHAIRTGELDVRVGLDAYWGVQRGEDPARTRLWQERIAEAEAKRPEEFPNNGWVVQAFQAAWSSIVHSGTRSDNDPHHVRRALELAVRSGNDTDTVAAIAGGLIGASYGVSAIPLEWKRRIHGWPGWRADDLAAAAITGVNGPGRVDPTRWPHAERLEYSDWNHRDTCVRHPHDDGVYLGSVGALDWLPADVDAVVSLCRVGRRQVPERIAADDQVRVWLVDSNRGSDNAHLDFVLAEAADMVARMRAEGRTVLLHCVQSYSRTPTVGALYSAVHRGVPVDRAIAEVRAALPIADPNPRFLRAVRRIAEARRG
ncbi:ADP-ribosylglycohydrolase family protein [uncultured Brevibacterium sp.]|uniref:ADP-ribosylglycohydrolase family protein n=1 Tax=uncultured Brevibacterium sp. TaxID=189678 RepID=UPI0025FA81B4|nr:ADP-ribosylglycohydrolase family protein [uncultured Brevibacterium sp.]